ncbi:nucleoside hydrolase [Mesorhizobium sp. J428]|uniref:nucleoside hydrolase n=1 Tax=Mesorhizobium sp. J428 TaxID=2898440 RepID=UPI002151259D|nr:nucleoside hydrolase [Mesorhizobium sp. J428]MCR5856188.1 nucleoside hydrolase [Mesorhizobium sp. J428]
MHRVIFDTDPGIDDAMALLFLHHHPDVELVGITTVFGNGTIEETTRNALYLKEAWGIAAPVARGAAAPIDPARNRGTPPRIVHGDNALGNFPLPDRIAAQPDPRPAHRFIVDAVRADPGNVSIVAVGRMTNLALALAEAPDIASKVRQVVLMGGAFAVPGNVSPVAEANIMGDPEAADMVMTAPWKLAAIGLDVTMRTVMTRSHLAELARRGGERVEFLSSISQHYFDFYSRFLEDGMAVHDSCACAYLVAPGLFTMRSGPIRVVASGIADGQTIQKPDGRRFPPNAWDGKPSQLACIDIDAEGVLDRIGDTIVGAPSDLAKSNLSSSTPI